MRRLLIALSVVAVIGAMSAPAVVATTNPCRSTDTCIAVVFPFTLPDNTGRSWVDAAGGMHGRDVPVGNDISTADGVVVGHLDYRFNYNITPDLTSSTAWCRYDLALYDIGAFAGSCVGTLVSGQIVGYGDNGVTLRGSYELQAGGALGLGPYDLVFAIAER